MRLVRWSVRYHATTRTYAGDLHGEYAARQGGYKPRVNLKPLNRTALSILEDFYSAASSKVFQAGLEARDAPVNQQLQLYQVSNFYTFSSLYPDDPLPAMTTKRWWPTTATLPSGGSAS